MADDDQNQFSDDDVAYNARFSPATGRTFRQTSLTYYDPDWAARERAEMQAGGGSFFGALTEGVGGPILLLAGGAAAAEIFAGEGGALGGGEEYGYMPDAEPSPPLGRTPPIAQIIRAVGGGGRAIAAARVLQPLIGSVMDDEWSFDPETGDVSMGAGGGGDFGAGVGDVIRDYGPMVLGGGNMPQITQTGAMGGAAMAGLGIAGRSLWSVLRAGGARVSTWIGSNGVRAKMADLWPAVRQYGGYAVAGAMGIGMDQLTQLLMQAPTHGHRRRHRRGITARDMTTTKRTLRTVKKLYFALPKRSGGGGYRGGGYRSYRPRRRY